MYPKVFTDFAAAQDTYGPVSVLPTPVYFYGLQQEEEIFVDIERGKTLVIRNQAMGEADEQGHGHGVLRAQRPAAPHQGSGPQPHGASDAPARRKAEPGNDAHVGAPMPGVISTVAVAAGQTVKAGDVLLSIEAMKMETALHAERDGTIAESWSAPATRSTPRICSWCYG